MDSNFVFHLNLILLFSVQSLVIPGRRFIFEGSILELTDKRGLPTNLSQPSNKLEVPRVNKHKRNRSLGSVSTISNMIMRDKESNSHSLTDGALNGATKKKFSDRYCFIFDDLFVLAKKTKLGTLISEPSSAIMFISKKTKRLRGDRRESGWASLTASSGNVGGAAGTDEAPAESFQYQW